MCDDTGKIKIMLQIGMPGPERAKRALPIPPKKSLEEKVREMVELIDTGYDSAVEFIVLKKLYRELCKKKQSERVVNLKKMIEPVLSKYGYHVGNLKE